MKLNDTVYSVAYGKGLITSSQAKLITVSFKNDFGNHKETYTRKGIRLGDKYQTLFKITTAEEFQKAGNDLSFTLLREAEEPLMEKILLGQGINMKELDIKNKEFIENLINKR
jgi:hypothetical protein